LQVWADFMKQVPTRSLEQVPPVGVSFDWLDTATGKLSAETCAGAVWLPLRDEFRPLDSVDCHQDRNPIKSLWQRIVN